MKCSSSSSKSQGILNLCRPVEILKRQSTLTFRRLATIAETTFERDSTILVRIDGREGFGDGRFVGILLRVVGMKFFQSDVTILVLERNDRCVQQSTRVLRGRDDRIPIGGPRLSRYCSTTSLCAK